MTLSSDKTAGACGRGQRQCLLGLLLACSGLCLAAARDHAISASVASLYVGQKQVVEDVVTAAQRDALVVHLRLGRPPQHLGVALIVGMLSNFPAAPERYYLNQRVRVTGVIRSFRGAAEMDIHDPERIQLVSATGGTSDRRPPAATFRQPFDALMQRLRNLEERVHILEQPDKQEGTH